MSWQSVAEAKLESIGTSIPAHWHLSTIPSVEEQRDVTASFIRKTLATKEVDITETDACDIVEKTTSGQW